jgi:hypothetical protein
MEDVVRDNINLALKLKKSTTQAPKTFTVRPKIIITSLFAWLVLESPDFWIRKKGNHEMAGERSIFWKLGVSLLFLVITGTASCSNQASYKASLQPVNSFVRPCWSHFFRKY